MNQLYDFFHGTETIDGPEIEDFAPTLQELSQLVKFHIQDFLDLHWASFVGGGKISAGVEDTIWFRLDRIRKVLKENDFRYAVELACGQFAEEVDINIWEAFLYGDEDLRRDTTLEIQHRKRVRVPNRRRASSSGFSEKLEKRIVEAARGQKREVPPEVLRRMAQSAQGEKE
jgi:hypothetical protein